LNTDGCGFGFTLAVYAGHALHTHRLPSFVYTPPLAFTGARGGDGFFARTHFPFLHVCSGSSFDAHVLSLLVCLFSRVSRCVYLRRSLRFFGVSARHCTLHDAPVCQLLVGTFISRCCARTRVERERAYAHTTYHRFWFAVLNTYVCRFLRFSYLALRFAHHCCAFCQLHDVH